MQLEILLRPIDAKRFFLKFFSEFKHVQTYHGVEKVVCHFLGKWSYIHISLKHIFFNIPIINLYLNHGCGL